MIDLQGVGKTFGSGPLISHALTDVTLSIQEGRFVAVAGPSGSGKTTLLNLIGALDDPTTGAVRIGGRSPSELSDRERADLRLRQIGFIFQHFNLVPVLTAAENVELPLLFRGGLDTRARRAAVEEALAAVGLGPLRHRRPAQLSGGERQRVAVARALAGRPGIVLADEPTASLDHETGGAVIALMRSLSRERGTTFLYATHDPELLGLADEVIRLRDGRICRETGP